VSDDIERSKCFHADVPGGEVVREGEPTMVALANSWVIINRGGGPTEDKPTVTLEVPSGDVISSFMNIRVADIHAVYEEWRAKGAEFLTPPMDRGADPAAQVIRRFRGPGHAPGADPRRPAGSRSAGP